ncbi:MAG TPA: hypothetical protein VK177_01040 [Flavobacteriales bacterium]|nr:hypothetical protein [Flavobacteriales bacterium]
MVKTSTQKTFESNAPVTQKQNVKPSKAVISFLVNYSKALEIKKLKSSPEMAVFKN